MLDFMAITKALADENRVRALLSLDNGELCVCQIIEFLGLSPSTASKHMSILKQARLVDGRKVGRWMYYRLAGDEAPAEAREAIAWIRRSLSEDPEILQDAKRLKEVLSLDPREICKRQCYAVNKKSSEAGSNNPSTETLAPPGDEQCCAGKTAPD